MYKETKDDLYKRYVNSYIKYDNMLVSVIDAEVISDGDLSLNIITENNNITKSQWVIYNPSLVKLLSYDTKFFNSGNQTFKLTRRASRQSHLGLNHNTYTLTNIIQALYETFPVRNKTFKTNFSFNIIKDIEENKYPMWKDVFDQIQPNCKTECVAISPEFAVTRSNISNTKYLLLSLYGFIGECDKTNIEVYHKPSLQEVKDFIRRNNVEIKCQ